MRQWIEKLNRKVKRFMYGRYGQDSLSSALYVLTLILIVLSGVLNKSGLSLAALIPLAWAVYRCCSKNFEKRRRENTAWRRLTAPIRRAAKLNHAKWADRKTHRYFACPKCREVMRVPKGKGTIEITCRNCGEKYKKKT